MSIPVDTRRLIHRMGVSLCFYVLVGCVGLPPRDEQLLAKTALEAAKTAQAQRFAPGFYGEAEEQYRRALADVRERRYNEARENFLRSRALAEKAENHSALKKAETGESP